MLFSLLQFFATKFLFLALHLEAGSFPKPLTPQEEVDAFSALRAGDSSAREKLIRHNLRLVAHVAKKYYSQPGEQEDLISIGTIGLMKAVDTFDSTRKARFSTYASRCIENAILSPAHFMMGRKIAVWRTITMTRQNGHFWSESMRTFFYLEIFHVMCPPLPHSTSYSFLCTLPASCWRRNSSYKPIRLTPKSTPSRTGYAGADMSWA